MKKNYMLPQAEICLIQAEDILTVSVDTTSMLGIGEGDFVNFDD